MKKTSVIRKEHFNSAHRLHNPNWSDEKNLSFYGKCNNPNFHGHNYDLEVTVTGITDEESGYLIDMKKLSNLIKKEVLDCFDHKNLNLDVVEFKNLNPTAENISKVIYDKLRKQLDLKFELKIKLYETERNIVVYPA
ncbi:MAG: 6-pyruvoyl tetrahydrobiopterin synthase [Crocinitomicaceae bacterium]|jgi:6-pyruvoyltetrahydropterin/6-carboxytetrahydropterin synthase|nr:6-pyruvoyl tetrahydrobiopterin synthase [Crocinitomicaceae bacterium]PDH49443.1 MAG: 6-pyruvoyl tetrahydrobiopterin synthase [Bacteroidetes bacterium MED-G20]|tara:strand:+ start:263 stop:673 length:411 start_codon:yes stop_codon:yes gene_type:complete